MKTRTYLGIATAMLGSLTAAQDLVTYETLAKPLPEILNDVGAMLKVKIVCSPSIESDMLCVRVSSVDPHELLERVRQAVAGKIVEKDGYLLLTHDPERGSRLIAERNAVIDEWYEGWKKKLDKPAMVWRDMMDLRAVAEFVTPELLKSLKLQETVIWSRPKISGTRFLPLSIPSYHKQSTYERVKYVATQVQIQSTRYGTSVTLIFRSDKSTGYSVYRENVLPFVIKPGIYKFGSYRYVPEGELNRRAKFIGTLRYKRFSSYGQVFNLSELGSVQPKTWGDEPLNAASAPYLVEASRAMGKNMVAYLDDEAAAVRNSGSFMPYSFSYRSRIVEDDEWVVAEVLDPEHSRRNRFDKELLVAYLDRVQRKGHVDFNDHAAYVKKSGAYPAEVLKFEVAALGVLPYLSLLSMNGVENAHVFKVLDQSSSFQSVSESTKFVRFSSLSPQARNSLQQYIKSVAYINVNVRKPQTVNGRVTSNTVWERRTPKALGIFSRLPNNATVTLQISSEDVLIGRNLERGYVSCNRLQRYAQAVATSEAGRGTMETDSQHALNEFIPAKLVNKFVLIQFGDSSFTGPTMSYLEFEHGTAWRKREALPKAILDNIERTIKNMSRYVGQSGSSVQIKIPPP